MSLLPGVPSPLAQSLDPFFSQGPPPSALPAPNVWLEQEGGKGWLGLAHLGSIPLPGLRPTLTPMRGPAFPTDAAIAPPGALGQVDQETISIQRTLMCPEAPGPTTGEHTSPGPRPGGPPELQEAGQNPPGVEAGDASGEAWQQAEGKVPPASRTTPPPLTSPPF